MEIFRYFGYGLVAFIIGIFGLSNIFLPIFYTIPRLIKERRKGNLKKEINVLRILWPSAFWSVIIILGLFYAHNNYSSELIQIYIGLGIAAIGLLKRIGGQNSDMESDFRNSYKDYLNE